MALAGKKRASDVSVESLKVESESTAGENSGKKKQKMLDPKKFGGMTEEEVCKLLLPDHMKPGLDIIFVSVRMCNNKPKHCASNYYTKWVLYFLCESVEWFVKHDATILY